MDQVKPPLTESRIPARDAWRWPARAANCGVSIFGGWMLGSVYWALLPPASPPTITLPIPNAYDELVQAGTALNWAAVPSADFDASTIEACQMFVQTNASTFASTRQALLHPSQCPIEFTDMYISASLPDIQAFRSLCRAINIEAKTAAAAGRLGDATQSYLDIIRVAQQSSRGGLVIHELVGIAISGVGIRGLIEELRQLDATNLAMFSQALEKLDDSREPCEVIVKRDRLYTSLAYGWMGRLSLWVPGIIEGNNSVNRMLPEFRAREFAQLRLMLGEAAIRRYVLTEGSPPESLASLAPKYLSAVPQDPFSDGPLIYSRTADGYLLYSVGANRTDDGGQRVSLNEAVNEKQGDLFFDARSEMPEGSDDSGEGSTDRAVQDGMPQSDGADKPMENPRAGSPSP